MIQDGADEVRGSAPDRVAGMSGRGLGGFEVLPPRGAAKGSSRQVGARIASTRADPTSTLRDGDRLAARGELGGGGLSPDGHAFVYHGVRRAGR
jgi:hypothetical protein